MSDKNQISVLSGAVVGLLASLAINMTISTMFGRPTVDFYVSHIVSFALYPWLINKAKSNIWFYITLAATGGACFGLILALWVQAPNNMLERLVIFFVYGICLSIWAYILRKENPFFQ